MNNPNSYLNCLLLLNFFMFSLVVVTSAQKNAARSRGANFVDYSFLGGVEYSSEPTFDVKLGVVRNPGYHWVSDMPPVGGESEQFFYQQFFMRYNFSDKAIGIQPTLGYSLFIVGGKIGLNYEYSFSKGKAELSTIILAGVDFFGRLSIMAGPKLNLTKNFDDKLIRFYLTIEAPIKQNFKRVNK